MKKLLLISLLFPFLSYGNHDISSYDFIYTSPKNDSKLHHKSTNIILRNMYSMSLSSIQEELTIIIIANQSGEHDFKLDLSSNLKTIIINPNIDFISGEKVVLRVLEKESKNIIEEINFQISFKKDFDHKIDRDNYFNIDTKFHEFKNNNHYLQAPNFEITVNNNPWNANLFFHSSGPNPSVNILDSSGLLLFSENISPKGMDWKVNLDNNLTYNNRQGSNFVMNLNYNEIDTILCQNGYVADSHDFLSLIDGHSILIAYDLQPYAMDTIVEGGDPNAEVEGFIIQELDANNNLIFQWRSWDYFQVTDNTILDLTSSIIYFIHGNAIDIDFDGHFLISSKNLDEITKIHRTTGDVIWRWGGSQSDFNFINDYPFSGQHTIRSLGNNTYILYDNGNRSNLYTNMPKRSRGVEYVLDTILMTAEKVWEFVHPDTIFAGSTGSIQRLPNNNTFINWGGINRINNTPYSGGAIFTEIDTNNEIVFQIEFDSDFNTYRAHKFDWFFDQNVIGCDNIDACNFSIEQINNEMYCSFPGDNCEVFLSNQTLNGVLDENCDCVLNNTSLIGLYNDKKILYQFDVLGKYDQRQPLQFDIYEDGSIEKKYILK